MSNHFTSTKIDSRQVRRDPAKLRGMGLLNAEVSGMSPPASRSMTSTVLGPALLLAMAGLAGCSSSDDPTEPVVSEKQVLCEPSPRTSMRYEHVCLTLADLFDTAKITAAKKAAAENAVIVLEGGTLAQLRTALGLSDGLAGDTATSKPTPPEALPRLLPDDQVESVASLSTDIVGIQISPDGSENDFEYVRNQDLALYSNQFEESAALEAWEDSIDSQLEAKPVNEKSTSPGGAWTQQESRITTIASNAGSMTAYTATYRLNGKDSAVDYYMVSNRMVASAAYSSCSSPFTGSGAIGHYSWRRDTYIQDGAPASARVAKVFESQPSTSVGSSSQSFSIGASLSEKGPGLSASFSESFSSSNIKTDRVPLPNAMANWQYTFTSGVSYTPKRCPVSETYNTVTLPNALIVEVPKGGVWNAWVLNRNYLVRETFRNTLGIMDRHQWNQSTLDTWQNFNFAQPQFSVSTNNVSIPVGTQTPAFSINALIPLSTFSLGWRITEIPSWLVASQTTGSGSRPITLFAQPGTPAGSTAFLQIDTNPSLGANSVEKGPLVVRVQVQ